MKKMIALVATLVMVLTCTLAVAETKIVVNGTGEVRVSADTAVISLGVNARDKDVLKAQQKVNETIAAIRAALIEKGVKKENINTDFINIYPLYDYSSDQEQLAAYIDTNNNFLRSSNRHLILEGLFRQKQTISDDLKNAIYQLPALKNKPFTDSGKL